MLMPTNLMVAGLVLVTASPQFPSIVSTQQQGTFTLLTVNTAASQSELWAGGTVYFTHKSRTDTFR